MKYSNTNKIFQKHISYSNRGMDIENLINKSNIYYLENDIAIIHKKPTPITIVKTENNIIKEAYYKEKSTTDYNGIYNGLYIDFEAKSTASKTSFIIKNIKNHQIKHLVNINKHGGIAFLIIYFSYYNEVYLAHIDQLLYYINLNKKSITYTDFKKYFYKIKMGYNLPIDYINIIKTYFLKEKINH